MTKIERKRAVVARAKAFIGGALGVIFILLVRSCFYSEIWKGDIISAQMWYFEQDRHFITEDEKKEKFVVKRKPIIIPGMGMNLVLVMRVSDQRIFNVLVARDESLVVGDYVKLYRFFSEVTTRGLYSDFFL